MRTRVLFWIIFPLVIIVTGAWWYMGYVNGSHPAPWPMAGGDAGRRSYTAASLPKAPKLLWRLPLNGSRYFDPVIATDGTIYIAHEDGLTAVSAIGEKLWTWTGTRTVLTSAALGRQGHIYLRDSEALYAFSSEGKMIWKSPIPQGGMATPLLVGQGGVIFTFSSSELYAISADGNVKWHVRAERGLGPVETANGLILNLAGNRVVAYDRSGELAWETTLASRENGAIAAALTGKIVVSGHESFALLDQKGTILTQQNHEPVSAGALAVGKEGAQAGQIRRDTSGTKRWSLAPSDFPFIENVVVDRNGSLLLQTVTVDRSRRSSATGLVSVDQAGKQQWSFGVAPVYGRPAVSKEGRIVFYGERTGTGTALVCIGD